MSRSLSVASLEERSKERYILRTVLAQHRPEVVRQLQPDTHGFLQVLLQHRLLDQAEIDRVMLVREPVDQNHLLLEYVVKRSTAVTDSYGKFIDALHRSGQSQLADLLTSVDRELEVVSQYQDNLSHHLTDIDTFLTRASRRANIQFSTPAPSPQPITDGISTLHPHPPNTAAAEKEALTAFLHKAHQATKHSVVQFSRCREVIEKLHRDCNDVAGRNADMMGKLRECNVLLREAAPEVTYTNTPTAHSNQQHTDALNLSLVPHQSAKTVSDEAEALMGSIREGFQRMDQVLRVLEDDHEVTRVVLQRILNDVKERRRLLDRLAKPHDVNERQQRGSIDRTGGRRYLQAGALVPVPVHHDTNRDESFNSENQYDPSVNNSDRQLVTSSNATMLINHHPPLQLSAEELARQIFVYMEQERQISVRASDNALGSRLHHGGTGGTVHHRDFDEVDKDLYFLKRELKKKSKDQRAAQILANHVVEVTRAERGDCLRLVSHIENTVRARRQELVKQDKLENKDKKTSNKRRNRKPNVSKPKPRISPSQHSQYVQSNFSKKLSQLEKEVHAYVVTDKEQQARSQAQIQHQKTESESTARQQADRIKELERKIAEAEAQHERYRYLYAQEKGLKTSKMLRKPVIVARNGNYRDSYPPQSTNQNYPLGPGAHQSYHLGPGAAPTGRSKPRLTSRAKHLTHLKDTHGMFLGGGGRQEARVKPMVRGGRSQSPQPDLLKIDPIRPQGHTNKHRVEEDPLASESSFKMPLGPYF